MIQKEHDLHEASDTANCTENGHSSSRMFLNTKQKKLLEQAQTTKFPIIIFSSFFHTIVIS